jgi:hypothetical protein
MLERSMDCGISPSAIWPAEADRSRQLANERRFDKVFTNHRVEQSADLLTLGDEAKTSATLS